MTVYRMEWLERHFQRQHELDVKLAMIAEERDRFWKEVARKVKEQHEELKRLEGKEG